MGECITDRTRVFILAVLLLLGTLGTAQAADMPVVDDATCWSCHQNYVAVTTGATTTTTVYGGMHKATDIGCTQCHVTGIVKTTRINYCTNCHFASTTGGKSMLFTQHSTSAYFNNLTGDRHAIAALHTTTSQCTSCHDPLLTAEHAGRLDRNNKAINCNTCHTASSLGDEVSTEQTVKISKPVLRSPDWYAPEGRTISRIYVDAKTPNTYNGVEIFAQQQNGTWGFVFGRAAGQTIKQWVELPAPAKGIYTKMYATSTNYSVYSYVDVPKVMLTPVNAEFQVVRSAISSGNKNCENCHGQLDHRPLHNSSLTPSCLGTCHTPNLVTDHIENWIAAPKGYNCDTCHGATTSDRIKLAIADNDLTCAACHSAAHGMNLVKPVPPYIPKYPGYSWTNPQPAGFYAFEPTAVPGYTGDSAQIVFTNRRNDVNASTIWQYYRTQLPAKGWTLTSPEPNPGSYFTASYVYGIRGLTVRAFNTENADGTGAVVSTGYRIEMWYK